MQKVSYFDSPDQVPHISFDNTPRFNIGDIVYVRGDSMGYIEGFSPALVYQAVVTYRSVYDGKDGYHSEVYGVKVGPDRVSYTLHSDDIYPTAEAASAPIVEPLGDEIEIEKEGYCPFPLKVGGYALIPPFIPNRRSL